MHRLIRLFALVFLLLFSQAASATIAATPDSTTACGPTMYERGFAEGKAYATLIAYCSLSERERAKLHASNQDAADRNMEEAIAVDDKARTDFWEGYYFGLQEAQQIFRLAHQKAPVKRFQFLATMLGARTR